MDPWEIAIAYHERTKHHFERYAASLGYLDWATQPDPFRRFAGAPLVKLKLADTDGPPAYDELFVPDAVLPQPVNLDTISALFQFSLALSAWKQFKESRWALRINPSSGNLHPTEGYLVAGPIDGAHDRPAVYHYAPREHALERRTEFDATAWHTLINGFPEGTFFVGLTSIHWREAWKYGERAYRYCQHDVGHAVAAISLAAALHGWRTYWLNDLTDADFARLLGLDREADFTGAERESPDLLLAVAPSRAAIRPPLADCASKGNIDDASHPSCREQNLIPCSLAPHAIDQIARGVWQGRANALSTTHVDWEIIDQASSACEKPRTPTSVGDSPIVFVPHSRWLSAFGRPSRQSSARRIIFQRRSAVAMDAKTWITAEQFFLMMDRVLPRFDIAPWNALGPPVCVDLALFVHRVRDIPPGLYALVRSAERGSTLRDAMQEKFLWTKPPGCPEHLPLFHLLTGDARELSAQVSCHQEIAADGTFSCGMIAEFEDNLKQHGAWFYRRLFWETGLIGQVLYLEAEAAGIRATGIGCFFDNPVHRVFGLTDTKFQSLYHFTVGGPKEDLRLMTWPPYGA